MTALSLEERDRIRLEEEYRYAVRKEILARESTQAPFWLDKFLAPALLVVITAIASGLVVPYILRVGDDQRRAVELKSRLIGDMVADSATAQMAMVRYNEQLCDYWNNIMQLSKNRRAASRLKARKERDLRTTAIAATLQKEYDLRVEADRQIAVARLAFAVSLDRLKSTIQLYYGAPTELVRLSNAVEKERTAADDLIDDNHQDALEAIYQKAAARFRTCKTDSECDKIFKNGEADVEKLRGAKPSFTKWRQGIQNMAEYILSHEPKLVSRAGTYR